MLLRTTLAAFVALALAPAGVRAAESYDNCTGFIDSLPALITTQGTWCLRKDLSTPISMGSGIQVATNNVTIDCNGFKVGNLEAGASTEAWGVFASERLAISVRSCNMRGFMGAVVIYGGGNHRVEGNGVQGATLMGINVIGDGSRIRRNVLQGIGGSTIGDNAVGIRATGAVDILDNMVGTVYGPNAYGVWTSDNQGGSIANNRIRGLEATGGGAYGIYDTSNSSRSLRDNFVSSYGGLVGVACSGTSDIVQGNTVQGFSTGIGANCADAGLNDVSP